jgi:hypothetical protein
MQSSLSCVPCAKRKVRCDRSQPCSHCRRRGRDVCEYPLAIGASRMNPQSFLLNRMQSERIERLEQYIRSIGRDPDEVAQSTNSTLKTSNEHHISNNAPVAVSSIPKQKVNGQQDGSSCTTTTRSQINEQARLVEHDEQMTYIEAFAPLRRMFLNIANFNADQYGTVGVKPSGQLPTPSSIH